MAAVVGSSAGAVAHEAPQGPSEAGQAHTRLVLENDHVRVTELFASPGAERSLQRQPPGVLVSLSKARFEVRPAGKAPTIVDYNEGQVTWSEDPQPWAWRLLAGNAHLFFVEVKSADQGRRPITAPMKADHSALVDPDQHHLVLENDHVRVVDGMASAGARSPLHSHPPTVLISLSKARFKVTINGRTRIFDFEPAGVRWSNHFEHTWQILSGDARVIMVEVRSAENDPAFARRR